MKRGLGLFGRDRFTWAKLKNDPFGTLGRAVFKGFLAPRLYGRGPNYDAERYWQDRLTKHGLSSLRGVGDEGLSEEANLSYYAEAAHVLTDICRLENVQFSAVNMLDIGCGNGYYTRLFREAGVANYTGLDITNVFLKRLTDQYPGYAFAQCDITRDRVGGTFDLIVMIDVIEHIMLEDGLLAALNNVNRCLSPTGLFLVAPIMNTGGRHLFNVRFWKLDELQSMLPGFYVARRAPFRTGDIVAFKPHELLADA
jgi:2-polyprenyl-3-methyl-5-hydroxy-6-metoxy-1,4-benzoquinol methylase